MSCFHRSLLSGLGHHLWTYSNRITLIQFSFFSPFMLSDLHSANILSQQGCSSDVPIHLYCLPTDLKHDWTYIREFQPGILTYIQQVVSKHALESHIILNTKVIAAEWQTDLQEYKITTQDTNTGACMISHASILVSAHGILHVPKMPAIPGLDTFKGRLFHSSRWDSSLDLSGKRVAVIGNGGSAYVVLCSFLLLVFNIFRHQVPKSSLTS